MQDKWPYLSLLPEQRGLKSCKVVGGVNTVVPIIIRVPHRFEGPDGNPEVALGYDVSEPVTGLTNGREASYIFGLNSPEGVDRLVVISLEEYRWGSKPAIRLAS